MGIGLDVRTHIITAHSGTIWCNAGAHGVGMRLALILPGEGSSRLLTGCTPHLPRSYAASRSLPWQRQEGSVRGVQGDYQIPRSGAVMPKDGRYVAKALVW